MPVRSARTLISPRLALAAFLAIAGPIAGLAAAPRVAAAQESGTGDERFGLIATLPSAIGFVWHVTDRITLRPDLGVSNNVQSVTGSALSISPALSLLYFSKSEAPTRAYGGLRFGQPKRYSDDTAMALQSQLALLIGLQHRPEGSRFALFGEVGPAAEWDKRDLGPITSSYTNISIRTAIGLTWYP